MEFTKEAGAIISPTKQIIHWVEGSAGLVEFPQQLAWKLHKANPGIVWAFAHTHPPNMQELSHEDITTCKAWAIALHPWPFRFITITELPTGRFVETVYLGQLESLEKWQSRPKEKGEPRQFTIEASIPKQINFGLPRYEYANLLWRKSYK